jgi:hypothetical protein
MKDQILYISLLILPHENLFPVPYPMYLYDKDLEEGNYGFLKRRVRYAIESATARYHIIAIKLPIVEAMKGW